MLFHCFELHVFDCHLDLTFLTFLQVIDYGPSLIYLLQSWVSFLLICLNVLCIKDIIGYNYTGIPLCILN